MSNHYVALNRGQSGTAKSDFTTGTSSSAGTDIELRIADGANLKREDVTLALKAFERWVEMFGLGTGVFKV